MIDLQFMADNKGKCDTCGNYKRLDEMVRKEAKGRYHCVDCFVDMDKYNLDTVPDITVPKSRIQLLFRWLIGCIIIAMIFPFSMATLSDGLVINLTMKNDTGTYNNSFAQNMVDDAIYPVINGTYNGTHYYIDSGYILMGVDDDFNTLCDTGCTLCYRGRFNDTSNFNHFFSRSVDVFRHIKFYFSGSGKIRFNVGNGSNIYAEYNEGTSDYVKGRERIYCGVYNGSSTGSGHALLYYNNSLKAVSSSVLTVKSGQSLNFSVGNDPKVVDPYKLRGWVSNVMVWERNLSSDEISYLYYTFEDTTPPNIDYINVTRGFDGLTYELNGSIVDDNFYLNISISDDILLYSYNITMGHLPADIDYQNYSENINGTSFLIDDYINVGSFDEVNETLFIEVCDGHTDKDIPDFEITDISGGKSFNGIMITTKDDDYSNLEEKKEKSKYNFKFNLSKPKKKLVFDIESPFPIYNYNSELYAGWLVTGDYWLDFNSDYIITTKQKDDYNIEVTADSDIDVSEWDFESIGKINCINETVYFTVDLANDNITSVRPDNETFTVDGYGSIEIKFNYTPFYNPSPPDNCSLVVNGTYLEFDETIVKNTLQEFTHTFENPFNSTTNAYYWNITCDLEHQHGSYTDIVTEISETKVFYIENTATTAETTTTTSTTTTSTTLEPENVGNEFTSTPQGLFYIFLIALWLIFVYMLFSLTGIRGKRIGVFNLAQGFTGIIAGLSFLQFNPVIGTLISGVAVVIFIGFIGDS